MQIKPVTYIFPRKAMTSPQIRGLIALFVSPKLPQLYLVIAVTGWVS